MSDWIAVFEAANSLEAHTLKGALESRGMAVLLKGEALSGALGELPMDAACVTLLVKMPHRQRAREFVRAYQQQDGCPWRCDRCGEENGARFEVCWHCGSVPEDTQG